ncbi:MAG: hypothetical protein HC789_22665 [Microcoleus sp. CSU_2_2]|nr:hypothetical protein [Microcoleus sp. SU_5_3]NJS12967.1 hypothetical protein [Microcoleus sp. CSU_2_2]
MKSTQPRATRATGDSATGDRLAPRAIDSHHGRSTNATGDRQLPAFERE